VGSRGALVGGWSYDKREPGMMELGGLLRESEGLGRGPSASMQTSDVQQTLL
jgi:hypothetical protein